MSGGDTAVDAWNTLRTTMEAAQLHERLTNDPGPEGSAWADLSTLAAVLHELPTGQEPGGWAWIAAAADALRQPATLAGDDGDHNYLANDLEEGRACLDWCFSAEVTHRPNATKPEVYALGLRHLTAVGSLDEVYNGHLWTNGAPLLDPWWVEPVAVLKSRQTDRDALPGDWEDAFETFTWGDRALVAVMHHKLGYKIPQSILVHRAMHHQMDGFIGFLSLGNYGGEGLYDPFGVYANFRPVGYLDRRSQPEDPGISQPLPIQMSDAEWSAYAQHGLCMVFRSSRPDVLDVEGCQSIADEQRVPILFLERIDSTSSRFYLLIPDRRPMPLGKHRL